MRTKYIMVIMGLSCVLLSQGAKAELYNDGGVHEINVYGIIDRIDVDNPPPTPPAFTTVNIGLMGMAPSINSLNTFNNSRVAMLYGEVSDLDAYDSSQVTLNEVDVYDGIAHDKSRVSVTNSGPHDSVSWATYNNSHLTINGGGAEFDVMWVAAHDNSQVTINGNTYWVDVHDNSRVTMNGYTETFWAEGNSRITMNDGYADWFGAFTGGPVMINGGGVWEFLGGGNVRVTGGHFGSISSIGMTMVGSDFAIYSWDDPTNPVFSGYGDWTGGPAYDYFLWGRLANGDQLSGVWLPPDSQITFVPLPGAALLGVLGLGAAGWRLRRTTT